jgi:beta-galactosidase
MKDPQEKRGMGVLGRRAFLRTVGAGGAALSLMPKVSFGFDTVTEETREKEVLEYYPGARLLRGPWRLRLDERNAGKRDRWFEQEPSEATSKAYRAIVPACWQECVPGWAGGIGWYFKEFELPEEFKGRDIRLKFWAVDYYTEVWVNGERVGEHEGGYTPFELEVTGVAKVGGKNRLAVRVVDPPRPLNQRLLGLPGWEETGEGVADGFKFMEIPFGHQFPKEGFNFGGIWQAVEVVATHPVYISDVFIEPNLAEGAMDAHVEVTNKKPGQEGGRVRVVVKPWKGAESVVGGGEKSGQFGPGSSTVDMHVKIESPRAWSPEEPYLYVAEATLEQEGRVVHRATARFGLREFTVKDGYFHLNGKRIFIKGGHHQGTYPTTLEFPPTREFAYNEVRTMKEIGFNFSRLWIKPTPAPFLDAADELGLLIQEEPPLGRMVDSQWMRERTVREVREMVKRDRNRPAIVIWNMINENDPPMKYVREQCQAAREEDPTRLVTESAGGPSHYYLPHSTEGMSYLTEHHYPGAPIAEDIYSYLERRSKVGQLTFFSEYGYGGMNDVDAVLEEYGDHPITYMEDYRGHVRLKETRDRDFRESAVLKNVFGDLAKMREACQVIQADALRLHTEAMRANPATGGYNLVQVFDSNAFEVDALIDFWRKKRKKSFYMMQEMNKPMLLIVHARPMNARSGEAVTVKVTLVNEEQISGQKRLTVRVKAPSGEEVYSRERSVEAKPWVSTVFEEAVTLKGESGRYAVEAALWEGTEPLVKREDYCTVVAEEDLKWPQGRLAVFDVEKRLEPFLKGRGIEYEGFTGELQEPKVIVVPPFTGLWRDPGKFQELVQLFSLVERGCAAIFLTLPRDGAPPLTAAGIDMGGFLSPFALNHSAPLRRLNAAPDLWGELRIGPYGWGLTSLTVGVPIPRHPIFEGVPQTGLMNREYGNIVPLEDIMGDQMPIEDIGLAIQIFASGKGKAIFTSLNLIPNLDRDALAEKLLVNLVNYAQAGLPGALSAVSTYEQGNLRFEAAGYEDCFTKYVAKKKEA